MHSATYVRSNLWTQNVPRRYSRTILSFHSVRCTQKEETVSDTPQQMVSMYAKQANAERFIWETRGLCGFSCNKSNIIIQRNNTAMYTFHSYTEFSSLPAVFVFLHTSSTALRISLSAIIWVSRCCSGKWCMQVSKIALSFSPSKAVFPCFPWQLLPALSRNVYISATSRAARLLLEWQSCRTRLTTSPAIR